MGPADLLLLLKAAPAVKSVIIDIARGFSDKDEIAVRRATEATLRLAFEMRQDKKKR